MCSNATDQSNADLCKARSIPFLGSTSTKQRLCHAAFYLFMFREYIYTNKHLHMDKRILQSLTFCRWELNLKLDINMEMSDLYLFLIYSVCFLSITTNYSSNPYYWCQWVHVQVSTLMLDCPELLPIAAVFPPVLLLSCLKQESIVDLWSWMIFFPWSSGVPSW